ncbi:uncharacterized protein LOC130629229 [Hydractinia symbiolongicarpus]|uniref:uncharacterized protein LOC130629229 n=1 Tax=Hydractinia symbiolongicarpus TaxID=13093 RepID=UPI00255013CE|nr:uncharacterized protein LOC130629229 [Hydractinia symbiolongicarpus]
MNEELRHHDWSPMYEMKNFNEAWLYLKNTLLNVFNKHAPIIENRVKGQICPWIDNNIRYLMTERDKARRKARRTNVAADWKAYKKIRNKCTTDLRKAKGNYSRDLLSRNSRNPKKFWDTIKIIIPTKMRKVTNDATTTTNKFEKENTLCSFFSNMAHRLKLKSIYLKDFIWKKPKQSLLRTSATLFTDNSRKELDKGNLVGAIFIDLSKAFDTVSHSILLKKLCAYGVCGKEVVIDNMRFTTENVKCGVPRGSILGPLLFLIFSNNFETSLNRARTIQFADDTVVYIAGRNVNYIEDILNSELKNIEQYLIDNDLVINLKRGKTEAMLFGTGKKLNSVSHKLKLFYNFVEVNTTSQYKYLASTLESKLSMQVNFDTAYKKASTRLRLLSALRSQIDDNTATIIYNMMILPLIKFNSIINLEFTNTQQKRLVSLDNISKNVAKNVNVLQQSKLQQLLRVDESRKGFTQQAVIITLARRKCESAFYYMGADTYNKLSLDIRKEKCYLFF